nr:glycosyltransferase family 2 protein [Paracidobacterium acidisoli]
MPVPSAAVDTPLVSAVIPTRNRPALLMQAVGSVLRQSWPNLEVIVVVDGCDPETSGHLRAIDDPRVRIIDLPVPAGGSEARNIGVRAARGVWIAFLDDDDEWLPAKLSRQMHRALYLQEDYPVLSSRFIASSPRVSFPVPRVLYRENQAVGDYLYSRDGLTGGGGILQTSTLLMPRELLLAVPFRAGLRMHQDWDWVLRAAARKGVRIHMLSEPLALCRIEDGRDSVGRTPDWRFSLQWAREVRQYLSPRAFSWFIAIQCVWRAAQSGATLREKLLLLRAFLLEGRPTWNAALHFLIFAWVPVTLRQSLRDRIRTSSRGAAGQSSRGMIRARRSSGRMQNRASLQESSLR